jgi:flagellar assembly factor FliW
MIVKTRDFGEVEIDKEYILNFVQPIYGFEEFKSYALISQEDTEGVFARLQSVDDSGICFIIFNPDLLKDDYEFSLSDEYLETLGDGEYEVWVIAVIRDDITKATVNLRSPIIINTTNNHAVQAMLDTQYPIREPIFSN